MPSFPDALQFLESSDQRIKKDAVSAIVSPNKTAAVQYSVPSEENFPKRRTIDTIRMVCSAIWVKDGSNSFLFAIKNPLATEDKPIGTREKDKTFSDKAVLISCNIYSAVKSAQKK